MDARRERGGESDFQAATAFTSYENPVSTFDDVEEGKETYSYGVSGTQKGASRVVAFGRTEDINASSSSTSSMTLGPLGGSHTSSMVPRVSLTSGDSSGVGRDRGDIGQAADGAFAGQRSHSSRGGERETVPVDEDEQNARKGAAIAMREEGGEAEGGEEGADDDEEEEEELGLESSVYVFGQIVGGHGFGRAAVNCSWDVRCHESWRACMGVTRGVTFTSQSSADDDENALAVWSHPLDFQLATKSTRRWPQMTFCVRKIDPYSGSDTFAAYGVCTLPMTSGSHTLTVPCWRASDRSMLLGDELLRYHTSLTPELSDDTYIVDRSVFPSSAVHTVGYGSVVVTFHVVLKEIRFAAGMAMMQISDAMVDTRVKEWLVTAKKKREDRDKARRERMVSRMNKDAERGNAQNLASYAMATAKERRKESELSSGGTQAAASAARSSIQGAKLKKKIMIMTSPQALQSHIHMCTWRACDAHPLCVCARQLKSERICVYVCELNVEERQRRFERVKKSIQRIELARGGKTRRSEGSGDQ